MADSSVNAISQSREKIPAELVSRAKAGDNDAYSEIIRLMENRLFRFFFYLCGEKTKSEDFCQETFVKAYRNLKQLREPDRFDSWIFRMGKNLFLDDLRQNQRFQDQDPAPMNSGGEENRQMENSIQVQQILAELSSEDRLVLLLVDMESHAYSEAAEIIGISESSLRSRLHRARKRFLEKYKAGS